MKTAPERIRGRQVIGTGSSVFHYFVGSVGLDGDLGVQPLDFVAGLRQLVLGHFGAGARAAKSDKFLVLRHFAQAAAKISERDEKGTLEGAGGDGGVLVAPAANRGKGLFRIGRAVEDHRRALLLRELILGACKLRLGNGDRPRDDTSCQGGSIPHVDEALRQTGGNRTRAAKTLGISRVTLWKKIKAMGLEGAGK